MLAIDPALQHTLIAAAATASAGYLVRRQWPGAVDRLRLAAASRLLRAGHAGLARRLAPTPSASAGACGSCNGCGPGGD
ncbi:DUF6587 family protein [Cognatilysobacter bugurensis]|uniref:DUF6587 family protein n=1 Tax=Cognatilysobacter bugurensis TaxID=543356 RepID=UPI0027E4F4F9|nr:DUF6587 family protein [Lysobacter bugurensis]